MKIDFYQEVEIIEGKDKNKTTKKYIGRKGVVMGISEENGKIYGYAVTLYGKKEGMCFDHDEVIPTGTRFKEKDFYNGSYAKVSPSGELLDLHLVDETTNKPSTN